ncbi:Tar ligand binding domain-containing protein [Pleionea litopenaei]|uniref:MCP four helix bundle domain-containing protein n=1 Tax=Pleionea litopenaei TaxID=3070815 RepID=A0AA51RW29_9GAMM|nr:MCP four helix bundle domain-containing protein [Pleionea sp. HL-JVS1]WMS88713.1 MCP four helix bundle domain-containing protein [Pleionea sp. HL-JVS1]
MNLTVSTRIAGGFGVVVLLLLVISIVSLSGVGNINQNLSNVVDKATPMLQANGELISTLLEANDRVNRHRKIEVIEELSTYEGSYNEFIANYQSRKSKCSVLSLSTQRLPSLSNKAKSPLINT